MICLFCIVCGQRSTGKESLYCADHIHHRPPHCPGCEQPLGYCICALLKENSR